MTNPDAADRISKIIESLGPNLESYAMVCFESFDLLDLEALKLAVTALQHQPEPQYTTYRDSSAIGGQCESCGLVTSVEALSRQSNTAACPGCGLCDLRPIYTTSEVKP